MTIKNIRRLQVLCMSLLCLSGFFTAYMLILVAIGTRGAADYVAAAAVGSFAAGVLLLLVVRRLRCPVCRSVYVGRRSPRYFTRACSNCGRRAGDTS